MCKPRVCGAATKGSRSPDAVTPSVFRTISLQGCPIKIASRTLTSRLQLQISQLVNAHQARFIKGRSLSQKILYMPQNLFNAAIKAKGSDACSEIGFCQSPLIVCAVGGLDHNTHYCEHHEQDQRQSFRAGGHLALCCFASSLCHTYADGCSYQYQR
jgi:hypothetical protein